MANLSEIEQLLDFLDDDLLLFLSDEHTPTSEHTPTRTFADSNAPQLTEKEIDGFNNPFEELNHDSNENQQTEVHNGDADDAVNVKQPSKASKNFATPVSYKNITEVMQKAVQSIEGIKR